ncbi:MAG: response regulator [Treponema sp.]|nr:response regulator [Treponema sp.]
MSHIVHVDNSEFFRKLMKTFLSELGHESESFAKGEEAIAAVKAGRAEWVISGMSLADMSGEEFIKRLMVSDKSAPVIVVTSADDETQLKRIKALGVKAAMQKSADWKSDLAEILTG